MRRLDVYLAVGASAFAALAYVVGLFTSLSLPQGLAVALFAAAPICAAFALVILALRSRAESDEALGWFAAGLSVGWAAMVLQLISFPALSPSGGVFGTGDQSSAALYLLFHLAPAAGAVAGALGVPTSLRLPSTVAGLALACLLAVDAVPLPHLLAPGGVFSGLLVAIEWLLAALIAIAAVVWVVRGGRTPVALRGWVGVALSLSVYDVALNALGGARFEPVWWSSLSLRVATYAVLALGSLWTVLAQLRDVETYSRRELERRESQLRGSLAQTRRLLRCAEDLARAVTPDEVATVLCADAVAMSGMPHAATLVGQPGSQLRLLGTAGYDAAMRSWGERIGWDAPLPGPRVALTGEAVFLGTREEVRAQFPELAHTPVSQAAALASLPLMVRGEPIGALLVWTTEPVQWTAAERELLAGLAAQGGQAVARALAYEGAAVAASTLQESLLPSQLPRRREVTLAARYVAGESGLRIGGDWYDCVEVGDHQLALVVGDVMGKGLHAAALMGQMRTTLRSLTAIDPSPGVVLNALDRVTHDLDPDEIATVAYVLLDLSSGLARVARAGHLPPLLITPDGRTCPIYDGGSPPLGAPADGREESTVTVPRGSVLVLYSDGMVEDRRTGLEPGLSDFIAAASDFTEVELRDPEVMATALMERMSGPGREDDMTLLVVRLIDERAEPDAPAPRSLALEP